jgi:hypothetical protein
MSGPDIGKIFAFLMRIIFPPTDRDTTISAGANAPPQAPIST